MQQQPPYQVFVINLDRSPERWDGLSARLHQLGLAAERVSATDGKGRLPAEFPEFDAAGYARCHGRTPMATEIGCYLSHVRVLEKFLAGDKEFAIVLEDDAILCDDFALAVSDLVAFRSEWDLILLFGVHGGGPVRLTKTATQHWISALTLRQTGSTAYMVKRACAAQLLKNLLPMRVPYDHAYTLPWIHGLRMRACLPYPVPAQQSGPSTIGWLERKRPAPLQRLRVLWYRTKTETSRVWHYLVKDPVIIRALFRRRSA